MTCEDARERERRQAQATAPTVRLARRPTPVSEPDEVGEPEPQPKLADPGEDLARRVGMVKPVLALTLGRTVGWALRWDEEHLASGEQRFTGLTSERLEAFGEWLRERLELTGAVLLAYELRDEPDAGGPVERQLLAQLDGVVDHVAPRAGDVLKHATGRRRATHAAVAAAAQARWAKTPASVAEARALCVLAWVLDVIGDPR